MAKRRGRERKANSGKRDKRIFEIVGQITWHEDAISNIIRSRKLPARLFMNTELRPGIPDDEIWGAYAQIEGSKYGERFASFTSECFLVFDSYIAAEEDLLGRGGAFLTTLADPSIQPNRSTPKAAWQIWFRRITHKGTESQIEDYWSTKLGWQTAIRGIEKSLLADPQLAVDQVKALTEGLMLLERKIELRGRPKGSRKETTDEVRKRLVVAYRELQTPLRPRPPFLQVIEQAGLDDNTVYRHGLKAAEIESAANS